MLSESYATATSTTRCKSEGNLVFSFHKHTHKKKWWKHANSQMPQMDSILNDNLAASLPECATKFFPLF